MTIEERIQNEGLKPFGIAVKINSERLESVQDAEGKSFWISDSRPGKFKKGFVPIDFEHPDLIA